MVDFGTLDVTRATSRIVRAAEQNREVAAAVAATQAVLREWSEAVGDTLAARSQLQEAQFRLRMTLMRAARIAAEAEDRSVEEALERSVDILAARA